MKTLILKTILLLSVIVWQGLANAQTINTAAPAVTNCPGTVVVPLNVTNCNGVGAISLVLTFDNTVLTFLDYQNLNAALSGGSLVVNNAGNKVYISWARSTAASVGNGVLLDLRFTGITGTAYLNWDNLTSGNCEYADVNGAVLPSSYTNGTATVRQIPVIGTQPVDKVVLVGQNTSFSVSASGTGLEYLWQVSTDGGNIWADLTNAAPYSGVTTATLSVTSATLSLNGYKYRCRLTGTCPPVINTNVVLLTVYNPVTTTLPTNSVCPGSIVVPVTVNNFAAVSAFSLVFSYDPATLTYTGTQNLNAALSGGSFVANAINGKVYLSWTWATGATIASGTIVEVLFTAVTGSSSLNWDLTTPDNCEYISTSGNELPVIFVNGSQTIYGIPLVTSHPANKIIAKGQNTSFSTTATGSGLTYLWQVSSNGGGAWSNLTDVAPYSGVSSPTLSVTNAQLSLSGYMYKCRVTGTCTPVVYSNSATLTVLPNIITTCPTVTSCPGQIVVPLNVTDFIGVSSFSITLNINPSVLTFTGTQNLNAALIDGSFSANVSGSKVYLTWYRTNAATIATAGVLTELLFTGVPGSSSLTWDTQTAGNCEYSDVNGLVIFSTWTNGNATIHTPPAITGQPVNKSIYSGGSTTFSVSATGTGLAYVWQVSTNGGLSFTNLSNVVPYSGVNGGTLTINPAALGLNNYQYRCIVSGTCTPSVTSNSAMLTVTLPAITTVAVSVSASCTGNLSVPVTVTNCNSVGGISLVLQYDPTKLSFQGYQSVHAELTTGSLVINQAVDKIYISWASSDPADIGSGTLFQLKFTANPNVSTSLTWDNLTPGNCEYSDINGAIITSFYTNSTVSTTATALVVNAGADVEISPGGSVQLNGSASGGTTPYTYLWSPATWLSSTSIANPIANPPATATYTLTVTGNNGCSGNDQVTVTVTAATHTLNLYVLLEGLYDGAGGLNQAFDELGPHFAPGIADQIDVELHDATTYSQIEYTATGVDLLTDGQATISVPANFNGSYYITLKHRNSIETTSANPVSFAGSVVSYSFDALNKAYGDNLKELSEGQYGLYAGDENQDGAVDGLDMIDVDNQAAIFGVGYIPQDINGDSSIDALDMIMLDNNTTLFISAILP